MGEISLSIALVTRNRPESLERCLKSLRSQSIQPFEVVVSDDSDPELAPKTEALAKYWDCRYIKGPQRGLYANRNYTALACKGTHIRTMDDDHLLPEGHMEQCMEAVWFDPKSIWTTGEMGFINGEYCGTSQTATQLYPSGVAGSVTDVDDNWAIADGATIYPKEVFDRGHRMVEWFPFGSSYLEFGAYLYYHGFRSRCIPGALIKHYADQTILTRRNNISVIESQLYASLCFNFFFKPNPGLAAKYILSCIRYSNFNQNLVWNLPKLITQAKRRWHKN
ncbi:glycosyltransferase family 2 protein [Argonema antarcticum]|uniref:glycosyltransferase family 2 protein n=1 Tax=Argonema antarcticum TaxID=2942763 RepID=UPI002011B7F1|nr:glycosyltransferase family 2 protein [Argonema antarcticum]MCL1470613.1 glycosyltransferase family 2 protein [Argonema antarcticum A004/B2]